jgi:D-alanine-D-alanine ligase
MNTESPSAKGKPPRRGRNLNGSVRTLGSVINLEEHVASDWWRHIFNAVYLKTDQDVVDDQNITRKEIDLFADILKISPDDKILDLCCGQGRHTNELARRGFFNVEGLDRSHYLIQKAKQTAKRDNLNVRFKEGDARKLPYPADSFNAVMILGNSFGYFETVQDDVRVLKEVFRALRPWGRLLVDVADGDYLRKAFQPRTWEWIDKNNFVCRERSLSLDKQRLISREVVVHAEKGVIVDQFYAERLYSQEHLLEILKAAGFSDIVVHGAISPDSQRNQDLGMMEKRILITGAVRKDWTIARRKTAEPVIDVVVVLGDPNKPDIIKPQGVFDIDDFYTIDQLKAALKEMEAKGYRFSYLNNHSTLFMDLTRCKSRTHLVMNLCDEGFNNDPKKELHIPALLEDIDIPYTGAGPECLAHCYDKSLVRGIAKEMGIPVPEAFFIKPEDTIFELPFEFPAIVKPNFGDASFGITQRSVAENLDQLLDAISDIREKFGYGKPILIEEFLPGKDLSVGIIGNPPESYTILPIIEEDYAELPDGLPRICGYEAKWIPDSPYWNIKSVCAELPSETEKTIIECCLKLFERLGCRDYARFDWRLDAEGNPHLLEVNPNPGWCYDGHLAKMAKAGGLSYIEMLETILKAAEQRYNLQGCDFGSNGNGNGNGSKNGNGLIPSSDN